jgi:hypothetical protein
MTTKHTPNHNELIGAYCKLYGKYGVYVDLHHNAMDTVESFTARLDSDFPLWWEYWETIRDVALDAMFNNVVIFLCNTEEDMWNTYRKIRGGNGLPGDPTPGKFYACTYAPNGDMLTENT